MQLKQLYDMNPEWGSMSMREAWNNMSATSIKQLKRAMIAWRLNTFRIAFKARKDRDMVGAASVDYLMYSCYIVMAFFWAKMADAAYTNIAEGKDVDFHKAKIQTAKFYFARVLPRAKGHAAAMVAGADSMMDLDAEHFAF